MKEWGFLTDIRCVFADFRFGHRMAVVSEIEDQKNVQKLQRFCGRQL